MKLFKFVLQYSLLKQQVRNQQCCSCPKPTHLICFKQWTADMVMQVIESALNLKCTLQDTHNKRLDTLADCKVMILQEINEPMLNMAVSKAATLLGAYDVNIIDHVVWNHDYAGRVFSSMADIIFVATMTHMCIQRFAEQSSVPVLCMRSRTHASIQSLSTIMAIIEEFGTAKGINMAYIGKPHPVLNSYLLLCPMLGANIRFRCCCAKTPVSPLLYKASEIMVKESHTCVEACKCNKDALKDSHVIISGPASIKKPKEFVIQVQDISNDSCGRWIYLHTCPRGEEVDDSLFFHCNARTFTAFENFQYIAAALMAYCVKGYKF